MFLTSVCLSTPRGRYPRQIQMGGTPARSDQRRYRAWGVPCLGRYPILGTPHQTLLRGTPPQVPHQMWPVGYLPGGDLTSGTPHPAPVRPGQGVPCQGVRTPSQVTDGIRGRYASCVHAGGLSCLYYYWIFLKKKNLCTGSET